MKAKNPLSIVRRSIARIIEAESNHAALEALIPVVTALEGTGSTNIKLKKVLSAIENMRALSQTWLFCDKAYGIFCDLEEELEAVTAFNDAYRSCHDKSWGGTLAERCRADFAGVTVTKS